MARPEKPLNIRLACMSLMWGFNLPSDELDGWLDDVVRAGYEGAATFYRELLRFAPDGDLKRRLDDRGLELASVDFSITRDLDLLRRVCEAMQSMGCRHLVTLGGLATRGADPQELADLLNQIGEVALSCGVCACYHNHTGHAAETLEETEDLLRRTDPRVFFGFVDVGHATKDFVGHPVAERAALFLERNWDRVRFIEFKDWSPEHDLWTEVGAGQCGWSRVFRIIRERGYSGWITVEQNGPTGGKTPLDCAAASREFIRKGLGL